MKLVNTSLPGPYIAGGGGGGGGGQMGHLPPPEKLIYFSNIVFEIADSEITRKSTN